MTPARRDSLLALARKAGVALQRPVPRTSESVPALTGYWTSWEKNVRRSRR